MYLKSLELHGFKSFPDRTVLKFSGGTTVIVGPNGSGKSNITDAMRWVLGELSSKSIRGSKMEDVIFAGADEMNPMSFAEVSVTLDDSAEPRVLQSPYDEVTVTRRYYRSGESEYFINRRKCRLRDVYELFMNTGIGREGYSIIGQGRIAEIISKKSEDRRGIFEESAGIARFRYKKNESEKKLAETEANMERVADIEAELAARVGPLEKEAAKARKYLELYAEKKKTDISLWLYEAERLKNAVRKSSEDTALSAHELEMAEDSLKITSGQIERLYEQSRANKETSRRNHEATSDAVKRMNAAESDAKLLRRERQHAEAELETEKTLIAAAETSRAQEEERLAGLRERSAEIGRQIEEAGKKHAEFSETLAGLDAVIRGKDRELEEKLRLQKDAENRLTDYRIRLNVLENSVENQKKRSESIGSDIGKYESEIAECDNTCRDAEEQIEAYRKAAAEISDKLAQAEAKIASIRAEADGYEAEARNAQAWLDSFDSRIGALSQMQEHFDGYNNSVRFVMSEAKAGRLGGIRGPVSTLITVEKEYIAAIETTLGGALQNIVTDDEHSAKAAIEALKRGNAGRATFYPVTTVRASERGREYDGAERARGFIGWGDELASSAPEYRNIVKSLLARLAVFDNLDNATDAARASGWKIRAVTLDGQQINAGGSFTGGVTKRDSGMLSRSALIDSLKSERKETASALGEIRNKRKDAENRIAALASENASEQQRRELYDVLRVTEEKTYADADSRRKTLRELTENMKRDALSLTESNSKSAQEIETLRQKIAEAGEEAGRIRAERSEIAAGRGEAEHRAAEIGEDTNEVRIRLAELTRDREASGESIRETEKRLEEQTASAETHRTRAQELEAK
ncbi:MAG: chromosome segregation protein SMC, partial [Clostridia bacterium]|nr:chromosome segregation protein SMC [Clostridia bacterium]